MAFVDEIKIYAEAGKGGDGVVRWRQEKFIDRGGPAGGNGGKGGDVYFEGSSDLSILSNYQHQKNFYAKKGGNGMDRSKHGENGEDCVIKVPIGSLITNLETGKKYEISKPEEKIKVLEGGRGGFGNEHFKGSKNTSPKESTPGKEAETANFFIELQLVADIGLIGLPNAGKSSLLNALTNAKAKVGNFEFTTLEPNLGVMYGVILADIPGLIEGASEGKGLGHKFLRHVRRTKILAHCISSETEDIEKEYETIRTELEKFDKELAEKDEIIIITKTDLVKPEDLAKVVKKIKKISGAEVLQVSVYDIDAIKNLSDYLVKAARV